MKRINTWQLMYGYCLNGRIQHWSGIPRATTAWTLSMYLQQIYGIRTLCFITREFQQFRLCTAFYDSATICRAEYNAITNLSVTVAFQFQFQQESCAIAKMTAQTARCALYKWIEWAVAEIWPFEIIQDGGLPPLGFDVTGNSAIRSADPENLP